MFSGLLSHSAAPAADFSRLQRASITFRDVAKRYGDHQVLNAINLQVEPGEVVAILGPSGSGKSTLIRLINQLESLSGGEILIDGKPTSRLSGSALRQLRSRVGFVFQQFNLYAHLTAQENITLALERVHGWEKSAAQARALALLRQASAPFVLIVVNNNGGQIFSLLPTPQSERERFYLMPQNVQFEHAAAMFSLKYHRPESWEQLDAALSSAWKQPGATLIELVVNEADGAQTLQSLLAQVSQL